MLSAGDLPSLSSSDVAQLLVAMVRLRQDPGASWMTAISMQLETKCALLSKAEHQQIRKAWSQLSRAAGSRKRYATAATDASHREAAPLQ